MKLQTVILASVLVASVDAQTPSTVPPALPLKDGRPIVATVAGDPIFLDTLVWDRQAETDRSRLLQGRGSADDMAVLDRLITIKLIVREGATTGLDELPEVKKQVEVTSREIGREVLLDRLVKNTVADPAAVEKVFRDSVRQWKTTSLVFTSQAAAQSARQEITAGATFAAVSAKAVAAKTAKAETDDAFHAKSEYLPQIVAAIAPLQIGQVSSVISLPAGFVIVKVIDIRYPENAEARAAAKQQVLSQQQGAALKAHEQDQRRQYVVINQALLKAVDYEAAKPGVDTLLRDTRIVAEIKGAPPVTVGDLTDYLRMQFFHGENPASQHRKMNLQKQEALDATVGRRLLNFEAQRLGIEKTNEYRDRVAGYRDSLVFDMFVQKVIVPDSKMREEEIKQYYNSHLSEYSFPGMLRVRGLAFSKRAASDDAMRKLGEGADFGWLASNAESQVPKTTPGLLALDGQLVTIDSMPEGVRKALAGVKAGEFRSYASPDGVFYVIAVQQLIPTSPKPYADIREELAGKLYNEKLKKNVEAYAAKLRAQSKVEVFLQRAK